MKRNTSHTIKRAQRFPVILIGEGLLVGAVGGLIVLLYRIALTCAGKWLGEALAFIKGNPLRIAGWFAVLMLLAVLVGKLIKWEPMISGSGIPQVEGEILGKLNQNWLKVLPAKFAGGFLCLFGGLSLGREGPSIQLGVMSGQGISRILSRGKTEERYLMTCGRAPDWLRHFTLLWQALCLRWKNCTKGFRQVCLFRL